jgi:hypothetical protein
MNVEGRTPAEQALTNPIFRLDIDDLRALAVVYMLAY